MSAQLMRLIPLMIASGPPPGQVQYVTPGTYSWVVPAGVTAISAVAVNASQNYGSGIKRDSTVLLSGDTALGSGVGGGNGGYYGIGSAGAGAGGYSGNGGNSGFGGGNNGSGGGGGGVNTLASARGGGVGLKGEGASGLGGNPGEHGSIPPGDVARGAGRAGGSQNSYAGNLRWKNDIAVTPGETLTVIIATGYSVAECDGGVRIIWGGGRSYPSNAGDV